jgi:hypothetical protein
VNSVVLQCHGCPEDRHQSVPGELDHRPAVAPHDVIESRHAENGAKPLANFAVNAFFGGVRSFERELVEGMNASLARIKAAAESG